MSSLTLEAFVQAQKALNDIIQIPNRLVVGSRLRLQEAMRGSSVALYERFGVVSLDGFVVEFSPLVPEHMGVLWSGTEVVGVVDFDRKEPTDA